PTGRDQSLQRLYGVGKNPAVGGERAVIVAAENEIAHARAEQTAFRSLSPAAKSVVLARGAQPPASARSYARAVVVFEGVSRACGAWAAGGARLSRASP